MFWLELYISSLRGAGSMARSTFGVPILLALACAPFVHSGRGQRRRHGSYEGRSRRRQLQALENERVHSSVRL